MEQWQLDTAERLASIERSIKYIEAHIGNQNFEDRLKALETFRQYILQRIAWVSGAFAVISATFVYALDYIKNHISLN